MNPNSRVVVIYRISSFLEQEQKDSKVLYVNAKYSVGAYYDSPRSKIPSSGLSYAEEEILMPFLIHLEPTDRDFRKNIEKYFTEISTTIPYSTGISLEIGLTDNSKALTKNNLPLSIEEYVRYRHLLNHPLMAKNIDVDGNDGKKEFYIFNKDEVLKKKALSTSYADQALEIYIKNKNNITMINQILTLLGKDVSLIENDIIKVETFKDIATKKPKDIIAVFNTPDFEYKYWIKLMVMANALKVVNNKYYQVLDNKQNKLLANSLEDLIIYFKDKDNSDVFIALKSIVQQKSK